jgi:hypothetical protein
LISSASTIPTCIQLDSMQGCCRQPPKPTLETHYENHPLNTGRGILGVLLSRCQVVFFLHPCHLRPSCHGISCGSLLDLQSDLLQKG